MTSRTPKSNTSKPCATKKEQDERSAFCNGRLARKEAPNYASVGLTGPTYLTILRMLLAVLCTIFITMPDTWAKITALVVFVVAAITDKIDGNWARKSQKITDLGAFLDPLADKMLVNLTILALSSLGVIPLWVFAIILVRDFAVDGMRMMAARAGKTISASFYGKLKTATQMTALIILLLNLIVGLDFFAILGNVALYLALALTVFSGTDYLLKGYRDVIRSRR